MTDGNKEDLPKPILIEDLGMMFHTESSKHKTRFGRYKCGFCGTEFKANTSHILRGNTKSCGCYNKRRVSETRKTHGLIGIKLYYIWGSIKDRTLNPKYRQYNDYGGRGITICDEWKNDFKSFYDWAMSNGYEENKGLSIDRINNDGNYCPENCRWTTSIIQNRNQRIKKNNTSGYKGVNFHRRGKNFTARISVNKKSIFLGYFQTAVEGAIAYNNYIIENNLEGFILNEIPQEYLKRRVQMKKLVLNRIRTPDGTVLTSRHTHDYQSHKDTKSNEIYICDGGTSYIRRSINGVPYEDLSIYSDDPFEILRENVTWGTYGRNGNEPLHYKSVSNMSSNHINSILSKIKLTEYMQEIFEKEISHRNECKQKGSVENHWEDF